MPVIEVLSEIMGTFYENFTSKLKAVVEKEVVGMSHGFLVRQPWLLVLRKILQKKRKIKNSNFVALLLAGSS